MDHHIVFGLYDVIMISLTLLFALVQFLNEQKTVRKLSYMAKLLKRKRFVDILMFLLEFVALIVSFCTWVFLLLPRFIIWILSKILSFIRSQRITNILVQSLINTLALIANVWISGTHAVVDNLRWICKVTRIQKFFDLLLSLTRIKFPTWTKKALLIVGLIAFIIYLIHNRETDAVKNALGVFSDPAYLVFFAGLGIMAVSASGGFKIGSITFKPDKLLVLFVMFATMSVIFISQHGFEGTYHHFFEEHNGHRRIDLIFEMIQLFMGFEFFEWIVKKSGLDKILGKVITSIPDLMWSVFVMSSFMDNILMALVGAAIIVSVWKGSKNVPFKVFVAVIVAANLGGAYSFIGDTTTIIIYLQVEGVTAGQLAMGIFGALTAQFYWVWYAKKGITFPAIEKGQHTYLIAPMMWVIGLGLLGILGGNILFRQPGLGLLAGVAVGFLRMRIWAYMTIPGFYHAIKNGGKGALFISMLLLSADMLDLELLKPLLYMMSADIQAMALGLMSGVLDNIPLTSMATQIGGYDWALLAYTVGFGGSMLFFSSSAGIAVAMSYSRVADSKQWLPHTVQVIVAYFIGFAVQIIFKHYVFDAFSSFGADTVIAIIIMIITYMILAYNLKVIYGPGQGILRGKIVDFNEMKSSLIVVNDSHEFHRIQGLESNSHAA